MIKLVRLDYRLLHGQVVFSWTGHVGAQRIIVVDDDAANDEDAADDDANATVDDAEESNIASSQTGGAMDDARDGRRWLHRGHLGCRRFASVAHLIISCAVFSLNVLIVKRTGLIPVRYPNLSS